jgi:hypothetical protein
MYQYHLCDHTRPIAINHTISKGGQLGRYIREKWSRSSRVNSIAAYWLVLVPRDKLSPSDTKPSGNDLAFDARPSPGSSHTHSLNSK